MKPKSNRAKPRTFRVDAAALLRSMADEDESTGRGMRAKMFRDIASLIDEITHERDRAVAEAKRLREGKP